VGDMALVESLQKAIDYMEKHLLDNITIEDIAKQANMSTFHFQRTFTILTDISVGEYLRRRRLTLAGQELLTTNCKIIDLAYKYGYDTPEAFSKAFRRQHGVTPSEIRKGIGKLQSYNCLTIQVNLKGAEPMRYKIVERDAFQVVGMKHEFSLASCETDGGIPGISELWKEANENGTVETLATLNNGQINGVLGIVVDQSETKKAIDYWIATEYHGNVPDGLSSLEIPASKWAVFEVHGPMPDAMQKVWKQIYSEWFPSNGYEHAGTPSLEVYTDSNPYSPDYYSEIWVPIK
jgi:AraC family transcriptional regulator